MKKSTRREFLANPVRYNPKNKNHRVIGRLASEKLNGTRAFWDGGISRGLWKSEIPYANTDKDERFKTPPVATGLWSKYGNVIHAPESFLNRLPTGFALDGEIWFGYNTFQQGRSIIAKLEPKKEDWEGAMFKVWAEPNLKNMFTPVYGSIKNANMKKTIDCYDWVADQGLKQITPQSSFKLQYQWLKSNLQTNETLLLVQQEILGNDYEDTINRWMEELHPKGGEGLILTHPSAVWRPKRCSDMLKVKFNHNEEARVVGYVSGKLTDKDSRNRGKIGSLVCRLPNGIEFSLSGFTDEERVLSSEESSWAWNNPDQKKVHGCPTFFSNKFIVGEEISFTYAEYSDDGKPKEARYFRNK